MHPAKLIGSPNSLGGNWGEIAFPEVILFCSHYQQLVYSVANMIAEITPAGGIGRMMGFDE
ncbi:MAG: hypothetical protein Q7J31_04350 [Syntrophales bacterium]|nr:hypothetical protein [Syntrophales bacterium]